MRFEFIAGALCLDFANTIHDARAEDKGEELRSLSDLLQWAKEAGLLSSASHGGLAAQYSRHPRRAAEALAHAVAIRDLLHSIFEAVATGRTVSPRQVSALNSVLAQSPGRLCVHRDSGRIHTEWTSAADGLQQLLFPVLASAAGLLAADRLARVRECASTGCTWLFVDESRNHSRRWCDMRACGNRMKARRHYQRARAARPRR